MPPIHSQVVGERDVDVTARQEFEQPRLIGVCLLDLDRLKRVLEPFAQLREHKTGEG